MASVKWPHGNNDVRVLDAEADILILAGQRAGLRVRDLINLLEAGMSISQLTNHLVPKLADRPVEN